MSVFGIQCSVFCQDTEYWMLTDIPLGSADTPYPPLHFGLSTSTRGLLPLCFYGFDLMGLISY